MHIKLNDKLIVCIKQNRLENAKSIGGANVFGYSLYDFMINFKILQNLQ